MARSWRNSRESFLREGEDNSIESNDFEAELDEFEYFLLALKSSEQISHDDYCLIWSDIREEWEIFEAKAREYALREPVEPIPDDDDIKSLLKRLIDQQQDIIELLKKVKG